MDVRMPDGTIVTNVPEGTTQEELAKRLGIAAPPSTAEDVAKSAAIAPVKAAIGLATLPGDARDLINAGRKKLSEYLPDWINSADKLSQSFGALNPINAVLNRWATNEQARAPIEQVTGKFYEPQTRAGKIADTAVQTATTMGRNLITAPMKSLALTAGITAGTEGAGALTNDNPLARVGGGLIGGGIVSGINSLRSRPGVLVRDAFNGMTDDEIAAAKQMEAQARAYGIPLMGTESADRGHQLASAVLASPSGNPVIDTFLKDRAKQVPGAIESGLLSQTGPRATPNANAAAAQKAAEQVIGQLERDRSAVVKPFYEAARNETLPKADVDAVLAKLKAQAAAAPASQASQFQPFINDLSAANATNAGVLDDIYKAARDSANLPIGASTADKMAAVAARKVAPELEALTQKNANLATGRQVYEANTRQSINPVTSGPIGVVAGRTGFDPSAPSAVPRVVGAIADANTARPETIRQLSTALNHVDKQAFPGIVQTHLENQLNAAAADIRSGANPTTGAKFRQAIAGTPQDRANFEEMMRGVARAQGRDPDAVVKGANNLLDVLERTGRTPGVGSQTATRGSMAVDMERTVLGDVARVASTRPLQGMTDRLSQWAARGRWVDLAKALTAPDSVNQLVKMAKLRPDGVTASYIAASLLGLDRAQANDQQAAVGQ